MILLKKAAVALAALSVVAAPVAASAASGSRAASAVEGENELVGNSGWVIGLIGLIAGISAMILISEDDDEPVSPN